MTGKRYTWDVGNVKIFFFRILNSWQLETTGEKQGTSEKFRNNYLFCFEKFLEVENCEEKLDTSKNVRKTFQKVRKIILEVENCAKKLGMCGNVGQKSVISGIIPGS